MLTSNNFLLLFFGFVITITSGCLGNPKKNNNECEHQTSFIIDEIKEGVLSISEESALPEKFTLKLKACIRAYEKIETKLPHTFWAISRNKQALTAVKNFKNDKIAKLSTVLSTDKDEIIKTNTDGTGCISWEEVYDYAHNGQSEWIILERHIKGISSQRPGVCTIPLAINPWLQLKEQYKDIQVADYRNRYEQNNPIINKRIIKDVDGLSYLKQKKEEERKNKVDIIINPLQLNTDNNISTRGTQRVYQNTIIASLTYKVKDIHGGLQSNSVPRGDFVIEPILLINERNAEESKEAEDKFNVKEEFIRLSTNDIVPVKTRFSDKKMTSDTFQWITPYEKHHSPIKLYLKVTPLRETAKRINPFEGIFGIGNKLDNLLSNNILTLPLNDILRIKYDNKILGKNEDTFSEDANPDWVELNVCLKSIPETQSTFENPIAKCVELEKFLKSFSRGAVRAGWNVEDLNIRFFNMQKENWLYREITSLVQTHISDISIGPIRREPIYIEVLDLTTGAKQNFTVPKPIPTEDNGNISFNITTQQHWYKRQRYFLKRIRFYTLTGELRSEKIIAINPWDYGFTHGYEVNQANAIRTTCLKKADSGRIKILLEKDQAVGTAQTDTMYRIFCHNPDETKYPDPEFIFSPLNEVFSIFRNTLINLFNSDFNTIDTPQIKFYKKFTSINEVKPPESYIHLFRSINVFPTPLIDPSLTREVYYNIRFKFSPRVVRHDDVPRGQQNKGPLRDGVYIFQMAVLANDQGRVNGRGAMVKSLKQFHPNAYIDTTLAGTRSLFSCPVNQKNCVELEDFIIPPQNIPIIVKDGMIKADIPVHIRSEDLLFADSKNTLVFRILPADPKSIVCKAGEPLNCTLNINNGVKRIYASAFDWKKTIQNIRPANENDYDMFFHTYQTPFIPAAWGNWNITHELSDSFESIANQYKYLKLDEIFSKLLAGWNERFTYSEKKYTETTKDTTRTRQIAKHDFYLEEIKEKIDTYNNLKQENEGKITEAINTINTTAEQLVATLKESRAKIEENNKLTEEQKTLAVDRIDKLLEEAGDARSLIDSIVSTKPTKLEEADHTEVDPDTIPINQPKNTHTSTACVDTIDYEAADVDADVDTPTQSSINKSNCLANPEQQANEEDLSDKHISYFASQNTLCTISINSDQQWSRPCGHFPSAEQAQQSFLESLNKQIEIINETKKQINTLETEGCVNSYKVSILTNNNDDFKRIAEDKCAPHEKPIREAFVEPSYNSNYFRSKITEMPNLPSLNATTLEKIITQSDFDENSTDDLETGSFLHALCGFWFSNFYSKEYITAELLLDGFRQAVKSTLYYQLLGIDPNFLKETSLPTDPETSKVVEEIRTGLVQMKANYDDSLKNQTLRGEIDELHKWANNPKGYGFDSEFYKNLEKKFSDISNAQPLTHHTPSWEKRLSLVEYIKKQFSDTEESTDTDNNFYLSHYLREAVEVIEQQRSGTGIGIAQTGKKDYHPVRKCMMNPTHFFGFEKKTVVGEMSDILEYGYKSGEGGKVTKLNISEDFLMNTQRDQGGNQQFEAGLSVGIELLALPLLAIPIIGGVGGILAGTSGILGNFFRIFAKSKALKAANNISTPAALSILAFKGFTPSSNYSYRGYEGTGKRKLLSMRVSEGVELISEHTPITIGLKKSQECLVIKPRFSAFEDDYSENYKHIWNTENRAIKSIYQKMGILLCVPGKKNSITEDYYYIFPNNNMSGNTIDPRNPNNKPFTISLRGKREYHNFKSNLNCYIAKTNEYEKTQTECRDTRGDYDYLLSKYIEFSDELKNGFVIPKMFHRTGDTPGVHTVYKEGEDRNIKENQSWLSKGFNLFNDWDFFEADVEKFVKRETE